jgi:hypothetical protein
MLSHLQNRVTLILNTLGEFVASVTPLAVDFNSFKLKILLRDGSSLRLNEQYRGGTLEKYAYYWLDAHNNLITGWDNAPHHPRLSTHPHHKHIATQTVIHPSTETDLEAVLTVIRENLPASSS